MTMVLDLPACSLLAVPTLILGGLLDPTGGGKGSRRRGNELHNITSFVFLLLIIIIDQS